MNPIQDNLGDWVCEHGTAVDVHCCNCHSGFIFDSNHVCEEDQMDPQKEYLRLQYIAIVCHEANKAYCESIGDHSQRHWGAAEDWQRASAVAGVQDIVQGLTVTPQQIHDAWAIHKAGLGWTWGPVKDGTLKTHPCLVPYEELPDAQRKKDTLFFAIVNALK